MKYGLYFHIPFCKKKCQYCDFLSYPISNFSDELIAEYFSAINEEWNMKKSDIEDVDTIYIGGGTPSIVEPRYIYDLLDNIYKDIIVSPNTEITIEINPGTVNEENLKLYKEAGINRISFGVQSTHNRLLKSLGRIHDYDDVVRAINWAQKVGFENISCDLIFAVPKIKATSAQTINELEDDIYKLLSFGVKHISTYSLILEEGTNFYQLYLDNELSYIEDDIERQMYYSLQNILKENNFKQYEISNFSIENYKSRHNIKYWECAPYFGFGIGAASYYPKRNSFEYIRSNCKSSFEEYIKKDFLYDYEYLNLNDQMREFMMLGFRKIDGPDRKGFVRRFGRDYVEIFKSEIENLKQKNLIYFDENYKLTLKGLDFANEVFREFI